MNAVFQLQTVLPPSHRLDLEAPPDFPVGAVEVTLRSKVWQAEPSVSDGMNEQGIRDLNDLFSYLDHMPPNSRSKEEIDRYVADERASWE